MTACIVTRGNVDLTPILDSLIFENVQVWDNSVEKENLKVAGRYAAAERADTEIVYFQDDDLIVPVEAQQGLLDRYEPGFMVANMESDRHVTEFERLCWPSFGSVVHRDLPRRAFARWRRNGGETAGDLEWPILGCDVVVGVLTPWRRYDLGRQHLPYAYGTDRVHGRPGFRQYKQRFYDRAVAMLPVRLNLGCGSKRLDGFVNLDLSEGWRFEDGLGDYADGSAEAITVSHALMYVELPDWPAVFAEFARVLEPGGILRITEDETSLRGSPRFGGHPDAVTLTSSGMVCDRMEQAGFLAYVVGPSETMFRDESLCQTWHGQEPKVFHVEGVKK